MSEPDPEKRYQGKKYRMAVMALIAILFIFLVSVGVMLAKSELAASVVSLSQVVVTAVSGVAAVFAGAQAWVDGKSITP